jgi:hypothetical protein
VAGRKLVTWVKQQVGWGELGTVMGLAKSTVSGMVNYAERDECKLVIALPAITAAMQRLFDGRPDRSTGALTVLRLAAEAGIWEGPGDPRWGCRLW